MGKLHSGIQKKASQRAYTMRSQMQTLTERYEQKEIDLTEFIHGLSILFAKNSKVSV